MSEDMNLQFIVKGNGWETKNIVFTSTGEEVCEINSVNGVHEYSKFNPAVVLSMDELKQLIDHENC